MGVFFNRAGFIVTKSSTLCDGISEFSGNMSGLSRGHTVTFPNDGKKTDKTY